MKTSILLKFYLLRHAPECQMGAFLEDYINPTNKDSFSSEIIEAHNHQQAISAMLVNHPAYIKSEKLLDCTMRKNSAKIIPIFYDHLMRSNWDTFSDISFKDFNHNLMDNLQKSQQLLPFKYNRLFTFIHKQNWYNALQTIGGTHWIMMQQTKRFTFNANLEHSINSLTEHYSEHRSNFFEVLPDLAKASEAFILSRRDIVYH